MTSQLLYSNPRTLYRNEGFQDANKMQIQHFTQLGQVKTHADLRTPPAYWQNLYIFRQYYEIFATNLVEIHLTIYINLVTLLHYCVI